MAYCCEFLILGVEMRDQPECPHFQPCLLPRFYIITTKKYFPLQSTSEWPLQDERSNLDSGLHCLQEVSGSLKNSLQNHILSFPLTQHSQQEGHFILPILLYPNFILYSALIKYEVTSRVYLSHSALGFMSASKKHLGYS